MDNDLLSLHLRVYEPQPQEAMADGTITDKDNLWWSPQYGHVRQPEGWQFLPRGDHFLTRTVKKLGPYWEVVRSRPRQGYTETLGILAPQDAINEAKRLAQATLTARVIKRKSSAKYRERIEARYREQFAQAVLEYLNFSSAYADLAQQIARATAEHAAVVGSGRVGRTRSLSLEQKAALAARAYIRHNYTDYEDLLSTEVGDWLYDEIKAGAQEDVDDFLAKHRNSEG